jgi:ParB/RepB/Spo0J family partition protein
MKTPEMTQLTVSIGKISADPESPRDDDTPDEGLVASIKELGTLAPILVRGTRTGHYQIIVGGRRWRAAQEAGLVEIPCLVVKGWDHAWILAAQIAENTHRKGLNPIEKAKGLERLRKLVGNKPAVMVAMTGLSQSDAYRYLALLKLPPEKQALVADGTITVSKALAYDRSPSQRIRGSTVEPHFDELMGFIVALGRAIIQDDPDAQHANAFAAKTALDRWAGEGASSGPTISCPYCPAKLPVATPPDAEHRRAALVRHLNTSDTCKAKHAKALRQAA